MKRVKISGWTKDGLLMILVVFTLSLGFLGGMNLMISVLNWNAHIETMVWNSYSSSLSGCVKGSHFESNNDMKKWEFCVETAKAVAADTREILQKEPQRLFSK